ncbi:MAG TPA: chloride channel protein [Desulfobacteraceae bacterium]|nr:chloride channel protein [Desulfobacteraceae bacterium]
MKILSPLQSPTKLNFFHSDDRMLLIFIGSIIGMCSGIAAVALNHFLHIAFEFFYPIRHHWWAFIFPALGALISALFLEKIVKEGAGHGVPEVIYSVSRRGGILRFRSSFSRLVSSFLTIGSGGSAGPEAPVVISGAAIGSNIANFFSMNDRQRITLLACGSAGAISSIFNAPIAGMVFTIEVILGGWRSANIAPIAIAAVAGTEISRFLQGDQIAFPHQLFDVRFPDVMACIGLSLFTVLASVLFTKFLRTTGNLSKKIKTPLIVRAAIGGCAVGIIGYFFPVVLGEGYHSIREMITSTFTCGLPILLLVLMAKMFATSLTLGFGGSGGIFAPCLVLGSLTGLIFYKIISILLPSVTWVNEGYFALIGMAGLISGVMQAPLTGIFLIVEITGGYEVILPLILISTISSTLCNYLEPASFYLKDLKEKNLLLHPGTDAGILSVLTVHEVIEKDCTTVKQSMMLRDFIKIISQSRRNYFPVENEKNGKFTGIIHLDDIRPFIFNPSMYDAVVLEQITTTGIKTASPDDNLINILKIMDKERLFSMPVVTNGIFIGMISKATILDQYRKELMVQTTQI